MNIDIILSIWIQNILKSCPDTFFYSLMNSYVKLYMKDAQEKKLKVYCNDITIQNEII